MAGSILLKDAALAFPTVGLDATGARGVCRILSIAAASSFAIPTGWHGKFLRVVPRGGGVQCGVSFGAAAVTLVWNVASAPGTGAANSGARASDTEPRSEIEGIIPATATFFNYVNETTKTISLELYVTEVPDGDLSVGDRVGY
jgi:hypothetical protein